MAMLTHSFMILVLTLLGIGALCSCNEASFKDKTRNKTIPPPTSPKPEEQEPRDPGQRDGADQGDVKLDEDEDAASKCKLTGDKIELNYPEPIRKCLEGGKLWNFKDGGCSDIDASQSVDCSFKGVTQVAQMFPGVKEHMQDIQNRNGKLIGCGEKRKGKTVVVQYFFPPKDLDNCSFSNMYRIGTACYESYDSSNDPKAGLPVDQAVAECLAAD